MKELTERQREILQFISTYIRRHSFPPTIREIGQHFEISVKGAHDHVIALKRKGHIRADSRSRTMELIHPDTRDRSAVVDVPILGPVAAGSPIMAEENWDGAVPVHESLLKKNAEYFALRVRGDSMEGAGIMDGDLAIVERRDTAENGEIVVAMVNEAMTLKRFFREKTRIRLQPENENYKPIYTQDMRMLGRLAQIVRSY